MERFLSLMSIFQKDVADKTDEHFFFKIFRDKFKEIVIRIILSLLY